MLFILLEKRDDIDAELYVCMFLLGIVQDMQHYVVIRNPST
jgi:hypothetical protein